MKAFGFAAYPGNGKTSLIEGLIPLLLAAGLRVSVLKHSHHALDIDQPGKDSHRHRLAGAAELLVSGAEGWMLVHALKGRPAPELPRLLERLAPCDVVLVEGFKNEPIPKIEVHRAAAGTPLLFPGDPHVIALATDARISTSLPVFGLDDHAALAAFLAGHPGLGLPAAIVGKSGDN